MNRERLIPLICLILAMPAAAQRTTDGPAMSALTTGAAQPDCGMKGVTGEGCTPTPDVAAGQGPTGAVKTDTPPSQPALAHQHTTIVPSPDKKTGGSFFDGVKDYFKPDEVKGGIAFGAAIGMLLLAGGPVGIIGGALIGAAVGAVLAGGLFGKLFGGKKKSGAS